MQAHQPVARVQVGSQPAARTPAGSQPAARHQPAVPLQRADLLQPVAAKVRVVVWDDRREQSVGRRDQHWRFEIFRRLNGKRRRAINRRIEANGRGSGRDGRIQSYGRVNGNRWFKGNRWRIEREYLFRKWRAFFE